MDMCSLNGYHFMSNWSDLFTAEEDHVLYQKRYCIGCKKVEYRRVTILNEDVANRE